MHEGLGELALDKAGLPAGFQALSRPEGQAMRILDTDGTVLRDWRPGPGDRANPEIDRGQLRDLLLGPLDVQWGRGVTRVVPGTRDGVLVHFAHGRQETFDLVVGDGSVAVYGVNRKLVAQRNSGGHVKVYAQFRAPLDWHAHLDPADAEAMRSSLPALFDCRAAPVRAASHVGFARN